jgi:hypothetical protein
MISVCQGERYSLPNESGTCHPLTEIPQPHSSNKKGQTMTTRKKNTVHKNKTSVIENQSAAFCTQNKNSGTQNKNSGTQNKGTGTVIALF